jgi:sulfotransferase family protein
MQGKIIGVGFQKTGTSTLREALTMLGYRVKDTSSRPLIPILKGDYGKVVRMLENYDAVEDTPWYMIYKELDRLIPGSKFILTIRDPESWYKSVNDHIANLRDANHEYIYGRGKGLPKDDKEHTINVYQKHNKEVLHYFKNRPNDLLVIDFSKGEDWQVLCEFLGRNVPSHPFPHYNKSDFGQKRSFRYKLKIQRQQIKNSLKIKYIDLMKLWKS